MNNTQEEKTKKKFYKKWWVWALAVLVLFITIGESGAPTPQAENTQPQHQLLAYKIADQDDLSYIGCKRTGLRVAVPDDSKQPDVDFTLEKIIDDYKSEWDDITVWVYGYSEESQVGLIGSTKGMKEYSVCE